MHLVVHQIINTSRLHLALNDSVSCQPTHTRATHECSNIDLAAKRIMTRCLFESISIASIAHRLTISRTIFNGTGNAREHDT